MIGQQQAQARFDLRGESKQQGSTTQATLQPRDVQRQPQNDQENRDVAVVAELGYN